eukprot:5810496-Prymnesium_polylepis.1
MVRADATRLKRPGGKVNSRTGGGVPDTLARSAQRPGTLARAPARWCVGSASATACHIPIRFAIAHNAQAQPITQM